MKVEHDWLCQVFKYGRSLKEVESGRQVSKVCSIGGGNPGAVLALKMALDADRA